MISAAAITRANPDLERYLGVSCNESNDNAMTHYVIVSDKNYHSMLAYAQSQAKLTIVNKLHYEFL